MKQLEKDNASLKAALAYAGLGWRVIPLDGKHPFPGSRGHKDGSTSRMRIARWWQEQPNANVGIVCDSVTGPIVLDADGPEGLRAAERLGLPDTRTATSGRPGRQHWYFMPPLSGARVARTLHVRPELDILGDGGYVVAPPSIHPATQRPYRWMNRHALVPFPESVIALLAPTAKTKTGATPLPETLLVGERNAQLTSLAGSMRRRGADEETILAALRVANTKRCRPPLPKVELQRIARSIGRKPRVTGPLAAALQRGEDENGRPVIVVKRELTRETNEALAAIRRYPDHQLYVRGNQLVRITRYREVVDRRVWRSRPGEAPTIDRVDERTMRGLLDHAACWVTITSKGDPQPTYPPEPVLGQVMSRRQEVDWPRLEFVTETPLLTPEGVTPEGYDPHTGILYLPPRGRRIPPLPALRKTSIQALLQRAHTCVAALLDPVTDFPFTDDESRAVYLASVLTILARPAVDGPVPPISVEAPTPGTGKTLLVKVISELTSGRAPGVTVMAEGEEMRKRITTICMQGAPVVLIDNATGVVRSNALAALFTSDVWEDRLLGVNEAVRQPNRAQWFITGNNLSFSGDLGRRVLPILLDADQEDPENRPTSTFRYPDILRHVALARPRLVHAALTLLRAWQLAGSPQHSEPRMGSFEAWDAVVRSAVVWATGWDPASTKDPSRGRGRMRAEANEDASNAGALLEALRAAFRDRHTVAASERSFTVGEVLARYQDASSTYARLRDALDRLLPSPMVTRSTVTTTAIGVVFRTYRDQRHGLLKLIKKQDKQRRAEARWWVLAKKPRGWEAE